MQGVRHGGKSTDREKGEGSRYLFGHFSFIFCKNWQRQLRLGKIGMGGGEGGTLD